MWRHPLEELRDAARDRSAPPDTVVARAIRGLAGLAEDDDRWLAESVVALNTLLAAQPAVVLLRRLAADLDGVSADVAQECLASFERRIREAPGRLARRLRTELRDDPTIWVAGDVGLLGETLAATLGDVLVGPAGDDSRRALRRFEIRVRLAPLDELAPDHVVLLAAWATTPTQAILDAAAAELVEAAARAGARRFLAGRELARLRPVDAAAVVDLHDGWRAAPLGEVGEAVVV